MKEHYNMVIKKHVLKMYLGSLIVMVKKICFKLVDGWKDRWMKTDIRLVSCFSSQALMFSQSYRRNQNSKMSPESRIATKLKHLKLFLPLPPSISNLTC